MLKKLDQILEKATKLREPFSVTPSPRENFGHYSTSIALRLAKQEKKNPILKAEELANHIRARAPKNIFEKIEVVHPGFINFWLSPKFLQNELKIILRAGDSFGRQKIGKNKKIIVEHSSLNIAKPINIGHLRNACIGDVLANLHDALGYKVIRWNYLGDWGTQFGKLIAAYKLWGVKREIEKEPIKSLVGLYVRFHEEAEKDQTLEDVGREEFRKLETGNKENRKLWEWFKKESLKEFHRAYKELGIKFDLELGENYFEKEMSPLVEEMKNLGLAKPSEGALIIPLEKENLPPALVQKGDGTSLYLTRDIANLRFRMKKYKPHKILYVVANEQALHFEQVFAVAKKMNLIKGEEVSHVKYGLVLGEDGKKFSTRKGKTVTLEGVLAEAKELAREAVEKKSRDLTKKEKEEVIRAVAIGALKYSNIRENRNSDIVFDWKKMLDFSGDSAPYLQYTRARLLSILRKAKKVPVAELKNLNSTLELGIVRKLSELPDVLAQAGETLSPNALANYLYELSTQVNKYYEETPILKDENKTRLGARLALVKAIAGILENGLNILGIASPKKI